jgi:hypothetical protein
MEWLILIPAAVALYPGASMIFGPKPYDSRPGPSTIRACLRAERHPAWRRRENVTYRPSMTENVKMQRASPMSSPQVLSLWYHE